MTGEAGTVGPSHSGYLATASPVRLVGAAEEAAVVQRTESSPAGASIVVRGIVEASSKGEEDKEGCVGAEWVVPIVSLDSRGFSAAATAVWGTRGNDVPRSSRGRGNGKDNSSPTQACGGERQHDNAAANPIPLGSSRGSAVGRAASWWRGAREGERAVVRGVA